MEAAGALPPVEKFGRGGKVGRPAGVKASNPESDSDSDSDEVEAPLLMDDDDSGMDSKNPPEIETAAL